ncbi:MAG TPA: hypothetical protein VFQ61_06630 [Polyangiaceae bacterium]|nr:hypothetical protein [Polyangiaceae bacterium]
MILLLELSGAVFSLMGLALLYVGAYRFRRATAILREANAVLDDALERQKRAMVIATEVDKLRTIIERTTDSAQLPS